MSYQQPPSQPGWTPNPQPPRKRGGKVAAMGCLGSLAFLLLIIIVAAAVDGSDKPGAKAEAKSPAPDYSAARKAAGLPPSPGITTRMAYIADLDAIDPDIVHGKDDKAISRGLSQCSSFKTIVDGKKLTRDKLIEYTNYRFTSPNHPNGHGTKIAAQILDVVHERLCPDF